MRKLIKEADPGRVSEVVDAHARVDTGRKKGNVIVTLEAS
jgi:hypothetical protein